YPVPEMGTPLDVFDGLIADLGSNWHFSYNFKNMYLFPDTNVFYIIIFGTYFSFNQDLGDLNGGIWTYAINFPTAGNNTWIYMKSGADFFPDLRTLPGESQSQK